MGAIDLLASYFGFEEHDTDFTTELVAGITTFLAMSYIIVVNPTVLLPAIMGFNEQGDINQQTTINGAVYESNEVFQMLAIATIIASVVAILVMALYANRPFGLAPGMGLNAFFTFTVVIGMGIPWQTALAAVFVEGIIFIAITAVGARKYVINLFPEPVKFSVGAGIGVFLLFIGLQEMQIVAADPATMVTLGNIAQTPAAILGLAGLFLTFILWARGMKGAIIAGILTTAVVGWALLLTGVASASALAPDALLNEQTGEVTFEAVTSPHYDITPLVGAFVEGLRDIDPLTFVLVVFTFFFVDFFDTAGTLIGVAQFGDFLDEDGELPEAEKPLMADAVGTTVGAMVGTSTVTTFVESSTGVEEGGRTGFTALVVAILFALSLVAVPVVAAIPAYASFIALVAVGVIMLQGVLDIDWQDPAWSVSAGLTITIMPLTYSIATGLAAGIIAYPLIKTAVGERRDVRLGQWAIAVALVGYFYVATSGMLG
ncbi:NCS2 family permease [Natrinema hispanicum]|uniref:Putative MFS transporter, AGZA family, xanthine/uracil permease n=1 Tax=Natrinema hispanicum TaxID=392421 RepID=A0A1G6SFT9_9EURY|nr:NCS2 family permease [Natrinema hispanicum]SDD15738.1 putative MFS transporter, AGZA family, xanthine/uracil permease [Natrinema hispanicum]SET26853.1 putative MFS transporter, AGZA family, xanthine/uracil permease [Natrinema hispanicum]